MRTCRKCGATVPSEATTCGACGAATPSGRPLRAYLTNAASLVAIIVAAALLHSYLQSRRTKAPSDFLPASTRAAIGLDLRPTSQSAALVAATWPTSDLKLLSARATDLAQQMVNWSGVPLDLREKAARWFGGELLAASIEGDGGRALRPRSFVLIARATNLGRARRDLDHAVAELAQEAGWDRWTVRSDGYAITVWGRPGGQSQVAYAGVAGCLLVGASAELVGLCIKTAGSDSPRLSDTEEFSQTRGRLPGEAFLWCYVSASDLLQLSRQFLPELAHGWTGLARSYLAMRHPSWQPPPGQFGKDPAGSVALAAIPEKTGLRVDASYWRGPGATSPPAPPPTGGLLAFVPREAAAFALSSDLRRLLTPFLPRSRASVAGAGAAAARARSAGKMTHMAPRVEDLPAAALIVLLPGRAASTRPSLAGACSGEGTERAAAWLSEVTPGAKTAQMDSARVFAADEEGIRQLRAAARKPNKRLDVAAEAGALLQLWARPAKLSPKWKEIELTVASVHATPAGGEAELHVKARPRYLLSGR